MYDAIVIGGGPGGYVCALRVAQLGGKALVIEKWKLGGTCTNVGCIPTKALWTSAHVLREALDGKKLGVEAEPKGNLDVAFERADKISRQLSNGIKMLLDAKRVDFVSGSAKIISANKVEAGGKSTREKTSSWRQGGSPRRCPG